LSADATGRYDAADIFPARTSAMKIRHSGLIRGLGFTAACLIKGLRSTLHTRFDVPWGFGRAPDPKLGRHIYVFWHEHILFGSTLGAGRIQVLISQHADGELITQACRHLRLGVIRGSSRRGGRAAMLELLRISKRWHIVITPDGPRGPRRCLQPGAIFLASKTGLPIVPFGIGYENAWRARSWDRFAIPKPFSLVTCVIGRSIHVPDHLDSAGLESYRRAVESELHFLDEDAQRWADGQPRLARVAPAALAA
jgi:lysophospholipid acyltransferase (LPLAT)-like uncharacterized protein